MAQESDDDLIARQGCPWHWRIDRGADAVSTLDPQVQEWNAWRHAVDPDDAGLFERRLRWDGLTEQAAGRLLAEIPLPPDRAWLAELATLQESVRRSVVAAPEQTAQDLPFDLLIAPMVHSVWDRLAAGRSSVKIWSPQACASLRAGLAHRIAEVTQHAFHADFARTRPVGQSILDRLGWTAGGTDAYVEWCRAQADDGLQGLLHQFPVLGRLLSVTALSWARSTATLLERLHMHRQGLADVFGIPADAPVTGAFPGLSDPHRGGHSVAILEFGEKRIVYKPKDVRVEQHFQHLVREVNDWFGDTALHEVTVFPGGGAYGFTGHVAHLPCPQDRLRAFYRAAGRLMSLLYLLGATDAHYENVIAHGASVALIDPETLFHVDTAGPERTILHDTVLRTGMLPTWVVAGPEQIAFDPSALGVSRPPRGTVPGWAHLNTDAMVWASVPTQPAHPLSLPVAPGRPNPLNEHVDDLVRGFREICTACEQPGFREILLAALPGFAGLPQRVVLRDTRIYGLIAQRAQSAGALISANARAIELERLTRFALTGARREPWWHVLRAELQDMEDLDIPYFEHVLGTDEVRGSRGPIPGLNADHPLEQAHRRISGMDAAQAAWQERLIRGAIAARHLRADLPGPSRPHTAQTAWNGPYPVAETLAAIDAAQLGEDPPCWVALMRLPDGRNVRLGMIGDDWYDGRTGIGAVQQWAAALSDDCVLAEHAKATTKPVRDALGHGDPHVRFRFLRNLGVGFTGVGGLLRWSHVTGDALSDAIVAGVTIDLITRDRHHDLIGGVAGLIGPLARLVREQPTEHSTALLVAAADHLAAAQQGSGGWASTMGSRPLTGYAHGAAGSGLALLEAGTVHGEQRWIDAGCAAFAYEGSVFDPDAGNWPDFREHDEGRCTPMVAWCHGAAGIGLSRVRALQLLPDHRDADRWYDEVQIAMRTTAEAALTHTDHLCCGLSGRAAVLDIAGRALGEERWIRASADLTGVVLDSRARTGGFALPLNGDDRAVTPGLMTGLAGIAVHLLAHEHGQDLADYLL